MIVFEIARRLRRRLDRDYYRFRGRRLTAFRLTAQWNERICLGKIGGGAAFWNVVRHDNKSIGVTLTILKMAGQIHDLARVKALFGNVVRVHQDHAPFALDPSVTVTKVVDRRVELVMRSNRR